MIDLHLHLDGSLSTATVQRLAEKNGILLSMSEDELNSALRAPARCRDLNEYLERFALPLSVMQNAESVEECAADLVSRLDLLHLEYAEIRFAPQLHLGGGNTMEEIIEAAAAGILRAPWHGAVRPKLILCMMRGKKSSAANIKTVECAARYLNNGVCALDLAGAEAIFKTACFADEFALARRLEVPFTIHAGEADSAESIRAAVDFGAVRIGHGIRITEDSSLLDEVVRREITLEVCPTSNIQTGAVKSMDAHPVAALLRKGARVCVNSDNMTVSGTDVNRELSLVSRQFGLSDEEKRSLLYNAVESAFVSKEEKTRLRRAITKRCDEA